MSAHLPECPEPECDQRCVDDCGHACICYALLACEARVRGELPLNGAYAAWYLLGQRKGVQAARDAVDRAYWKDSPTVQRGTAHGVTLALAAIDSLRGQ